MTAPERSQACSFLRDLARFQDGETKLQAELEDLPELDLEQPPAVAAIEVADDVLEFQNELASAVANTMPFSTTSTTSTRNSLYFLARGIAECFWCFDLLLILCPPVWQPRGRHTG